jgi:hypothetical protein
MHVSGDGDDIYVIANAWSGELTFELPWIRGKHWVQMFDTSQDRVEQAPAGTTYTAQPRSVVVLLGARDVRPRRRRKCR